MFRITDPNLKARKYQSDALEKAREAGNSIICLPTGTGKTLVGAMYACELLNDGKVRRIMVLEPTRFLVRQVTEYYQKNTNIQTDWVDGTISHENRRSIWLNPENRIIVCTPQTAVNDMHWLDFDAAIIDECHHTTGDHAYTKLLQDYGFKYKLGLSATIPHKNEDEIKQYIGNIFRWSLKDPDIQKYVPPLYPDFYDSNLDECHKDIIVKIEKLRQSLRNSWKSGLCSLAVRMLVRDGAAALKETLNKANTMSEILQPVIGPELERCTELHKLEQMKKILQQHDFEKAIVFVDRVVVAKILHKVFRELNPVLLLGRRHSSTDMQKNAVKNAASKDVKLVISTSAGEEGIDIPSADLLIIWSNTVNSVRFIQRLGRLLRKSKENSDKLKIAAFIATPDTPDYDALTDGLYMAHDLGIEVPGIDYNALKKKTLVYSIVEHLQSSSNPMTISEIADALDIDVDKAEKWLSNNLKRGDVFYYYVFPYDPIQKANELHIYNKTENVPKGLKEDYNRFIEKIKNKAINNYGSSINNLGKRFGITGVNQEIIKKYKEGIGKNNFVNYVINRFTKGDRRYALVSDAELIMDDYSEYMSVPEDYKFTLKYGFSYNKKSQFEEYGTVEEIFNKIKDVATGKMVYLYFSGYGTYTKSNIIYNGAYSESALKLIVRNAGWICWTIEKMNNII